MRSTSRWVVPLAMGMVLGASGCTHQVRPSPRLDGIGGAVLPLRAKYYIAPAERARVHSDRYGALGPGHTWNVEIGEALATSFPDALRAVFASVAEASGPDDLADADVLLVPTIAQFDITGGSFRSRIDVRLKGLGPDRAVTMDEVFHGTPTQGRAGTAWLGGALGGKAALKGSAEYAFRDVMPKIVAHLRAVYARPPVPVS